METGTMSPKGLAPPLQFYPGQDTPYASMCFAKSPDSSAWLEKKQPRSNLCSVHLFHLSQYRPPRLPVLAEPG
jgi:hypothetical protein